MGLVKYHQVEDGGRNSLPMESEGKSEPQCPPKEPWNHWEGPESNGLYDPQLEKDACGVGFIVSIDGVASHKVIFKFLFFLYHK